MAINNRMLVAVVAGVAAVAVLAGVLALMQGQGGEIAEDGTQPHSTGKRLRIMATFYPLYEFTKAIVGDRADVDMFIPSGLEPHDWEPSARDLERLKDYDLLIYNSALFEPYIGQVSNLGYRLEMVESAKGLMVEHDPHVWLDPILAKEQVRVILKSIVSMDGSNKDYYTRNAEAYMARLDDLHGRFEKGLEECDRRVFITLHKAYHYLASRYGLEQVAITGVEPEHDVPAGQIREIIDVAREHDINVVYAEEGMDDRLVRALAEEIGGSVLTLSPIEVLEDEDVEQGKTYIAKMEENLESLRLGLGCR
ncbi:MAG: zinc ABC transporter substrate-binding protein [Candidatus Nitrosocaldus sp.]|nr:zinc ABC transporter substrate-binding protein [Candidatus Nitrosocaldus sp.]MDW8276273.1 zinc ABC transporter substrate-binding protein [Candidatus Nitrosocaldus sp.]